MINTKHAWWNGRIVPLAEANVNVSAFAIHYGVGVFEGIRCYERADGRGAIFRLREHIERLFESAKICAFDIPYAPAVIEEACREVMRRNDLREAYVRPFAFTGAGALGLGATGNPIDVAVICWSWGAIHGAEASGTGLRAHVSSYVRGHLNATMSKGKIAGQYVNSVLAKRDSQRLGYDEAIMLDADGRVAEATAENIFVVMRGKLLTPPLDLPILAGITRDAIITIAREAGLDVVERSFTRDMLYAASEVFLTGTGAEIAPVREIDGRIVGDGTPGPITRKLRDAFFATVRGPGEPHPEWLSYL